jgi:hypothetical protein
MQTTPVAGGPAPLTPTEAYYLEGVLEDESTLARLLHWKNVEAPRVLVPNFWLWGSRAGDTGLAARLARTYLPRWRRCWSSAGELVTRCGLSTLQTPGAVVVMARTGAPVYASVSDFPTPSAAILWAMCKASIHYLEAEQADRAAWVGAELARRIREVAP